MHSGQPDSGCPKAVYFPACGKPGRAPAGKRGRHTAFFAYLQGHPADKGRRAFIPLCENGRGTASGRRQDAGENAGYGYGRGSDRSQRYDTSVFSSAFFGAVSQRVPTNQSYRNQCPHTRNHLQPGGRKN